MILILLICPSDSLCPSSFVLKQWCRGFQCHRAKPMCWPNSVRVSIESTNTSGITDQKRTAAARGARMSSTLTPEQLLSADWRQALPIFVQSIFVHLGSSQGVERPSWSPLLRVKLSWSWAFSDQNLMQAFTMFARTGQEMHGQHGQHWRLMGSLGITG